MHYEEYIKELIKDGYIDANTLEPLRCQKCESKKLDQQNPIYEDHYVVEYDIVCNKCGTVAGLWAYGQYEVK